MRCKLLARPGRQLIVEAAWTSRSSHNSDDCDSCARWVWSSEWLFRACRWVRQVLATAKVLIFRRRLELLSSPKAWQRRCCYSLLLTTRCVPCVVCNSTQINSAWIIVIFFCDVCGWRNMKYVVRFPYNFLLTYIIAALRPICSAFST